MPSIKDIREFLEMGWFPALVGVIASASLLYAEHIGWRYLAELPSWVFSSAAILLIACGAVVAANILRAPIWFASLIKSKWNKNVARKVKIRNLLELNSREAYLLQFFFSANERVFHAPMDDQTIEALCAKRLINRHTGTHSILAWPFSFDHDVWNYMIKNENEFRLPDELMEKHPVRWRLGW